MTGSTKSHNNRCHGRRHHRKKPAFRQLPRIFHGAVSWNHASFVCPGKSECERAHATRINHHQAIINSTQRKVSSARACVPGTHSYKGPAEREHFDLFLNRTATHCRERSSSVGNRSRHARKKLRRRKDDSRPVWCLGACMRLWFSEACVRARVQLTL